jgi:hypothetical protein
VLDFWLPFLSRKKEKQPLAVSKYTFNTLEVYSTSNSFHSTYLVDHVLSCATATTDKPWEAMLKSYSSFLSNPVSNWQHDIFSSQSQRLIAHSFL